jgi:phytoene dehydrogenase-like protein
MTWTVAAVGRVSKMAGGLRRMSAESFDGIVIGSGQHGLILGTYLAKCGLRILLLERRLQYGGGLGTQQVTLPGFYHQLHSQNHFNISEAPWYKDLELSETVPYITPRYDFGQPNRDGTALVLSRNIDETLHAIGRFSKRDAETYREWNLKADRISNEIFWPERYSEPLSEKERDDLLSRSELGRDFLAMIDRQPLDLIKELFENEHVKHLLLFKLSLFGTVLYDQVTTRSPMGAAVRAFDLVAGYQVCKHGSVSLARGLMEKFIAAGGRFMAGAHVSRIIVEGNRATGVELSDGRTIRASKFVASTVDPTQTFERMIGFEQLPAAYRDKVRNFAHCDWTLFGVYLCLRELPNYIGSDFDPNVNHTLKVNIGSDSLEQLFALHEEVAEGKVPSRISFGCGHLTDFDPSQAPPGYHTAYAWHAMPYAPGGDPENIEKIKEEFADRIVDKWREFAPNLTPDNILKRYVYTANDYSKEIINMVRGDIFVGSFRGDQTMWNHFGYRTPIDNLYMAGSPTHPGGSISGGGGYIASRIIAEDLGAKLWWKPMDARRSLEALAQNEASPRTKARA